MSKSRRYRYINTLLGEIGPAGEDGQPGEGYDMGKIYFKDIDENHPNFEDQEIILTVDVEKTIQNGCNWTDFVEVYNQSNINELQHIRISNPRPESLDEFIGKIYVNLETPEIPNLLNYSLQCDLSGINIIGDTLQNITIDSIQKYRQTFDVFGPVCYNLTYLEEQRTQCINYGNIYLFKITKNKGHEQYPKQLVMKNIAMIFHVYKR